MPYLLRFTRLVCFVGCILLLSNGDAPCTAEDLPKVVVPQWQIEPLTDSRDLVTPTGCCHDDQGRLLVIECHTHFPPEDYDGPETDRIYLFDDTNGDGKLDRKRTFYEGGSATMGIVPLDDGWIAVATRSEVIRIRDTNGDDVADTREVLLTLKTPATYPHNGLGGMAVGRDGWLYVGQGENLGEDYQLIAADGSQQVGGGEGGNIFRCTQSGGKLERVATGFWNPFGICMDPAGRLWTVGNDPDARPPCRLLHVAPGGDYGFQFRFGRAGTHPLQAWDGEFPGTLPMAAGTGEAPCAVVVHEGYLWVTSWGDNRIERYALQNETPQKGWRTRTEIAVQGDAFFRPVGLSIARDGSLVVTDWVDRSYPVHGRGRVWRLHSTANSPATKFPDLTATEQRAKKLRNDQTMTASQRLRALDDTNAFVHQAAVHGLVQNQQLESITWEQADSNAQRVGLLEAWRWRALTSPPSVSEAVRQDWIEKGLRAPSPEVVRAALRWAAESRATSLLPRIREVLERPQMTPELFNATIAAIAYLETGSAARGKRDPAIEKLLISFAANPDHSGRLRALAVRKLPTEAELPKSDTLLQWLKTSNDRPLAIEIVRLLAARPSELSSSTLAAIAADTAIDDQTRADALAGLSADASKHASLLRKLSTPRNAAVIRSEAERISRRAYLLSMQQYPPREKLDAWLEAIGTGGDANAGRRVFFRTTCANCHAHSGRGARTGPDLTTLDNMTKRRLVESILHPSKEIGPLFVPWRVITTEGRVLTGLKLDRAGQDGALRFQGADGNVFAVELDEIDEIIPVQQSIMPEGLERFMTVAEFRDLLEFLSNEDATSPQNSDQHVGRTQP